MVVFLKKDDRVQQGIDSVVTKKMFYEKEQSVENIIV